MGSHCLPAVRTVLSQKTQAMRTMEKQSNPTKKLLLRDLNHRSQPSLQTRNPQFEPSRSFVALRRQYSTTGFPAGTFPTQQKTQMQTPICYQQASTHTNATRSHTTSSVGTFRSPPKKNGD